MPTWHRVQLDLYIMNQDELDRLRLWMSNATDYEFPADIIFWADEVEGLSND